MIASGIRSAHSRSPHRRAATLAFLLVVPFVAACADFDDPSWPESGRSVTLGDVDIGDLTIATPVRAGRTAIYLRIRNRGEESGRFEGLDLMGLGMASIHRSAVEDGIVRMTPEEALEIVGREVLTLGPGGLHVMVEGVPGNLPAGDSVPVWIELGDAGRVLGHALVAPLEAIEEIFPPQR